MPRSPPLSILVTCLLSFVCALPGRAADSPAGFAVIASSGVAHEQLTRNSLALIYRRRQNLWQDGTRVHPVNLPASDPLRIAFSRCVLGQSPQDTEDYWRQMYFHGTLPPYVLESQRAVVLFVASTRGAIGYVAKCPENASVKVLMVFGHPRGCRPPTASCVPLQDS